MKKAFVIMMCTILLCSAMVGCKKTEEPQSPPPPSPLPSIDFLQPWAFCDMTEEQLVAHFEKLVGYGINTVILQNTSEYDNGIPEKSYVMSSEDFPVIYTDFFATFIRAAKSCGLQVWAGTSNDNMWWDYSVHGYGEDAMSIFLAEEKQAIRDIMTGYEVDAIYFSNEMYSNNAGYEVAWATLLNAVIETVEEYSDTMPIMLSPFTSTAFPTDDVTVFDMWARFFAATNFRSIDCFFIQDGFGGTPRASTPTISDTIKLRNTAIRRACTENCTASFCVNVELFASDGYATPERLAVQIEQARELSMRDIACFSMSHYFETDEQLRDDYVQTFLDK